MTVIGIVTKIVGYGIRRKIKPTSLLDMEKLRLALENLATNGDSVDESSVKEHGGDKWVEGIGEVR